MIYATDCDGFWVDGLMWSQVERKLKRSREDRGTGTGPGSDWIINVMQRTK